MANSSKLLVVGDLLRDAHLGEYLVSPEPTERSDQFVQGYRHALEQKRRRVGSTWTDAFIDGWRNAWADRKKGTICEVFAG